LLRVCGPTGFPVESTAQMLNVPFSPGAYEVLLNSIFNAAAGRVLTVTEIASVELTVAAAPVVPELRRVIVAVPAATPLSAHS